MLRYEIQRQQNIKKEEEIKIEKEEEKQVNKKNTREDDKNLKEIKSKKDIL